MFFKILSQIENTELIATGHGIRNLTRLNKVYGHASWRKLKGECLVELQDGTIIRAEVHYYEGHGIGKKEFKIKRYL